MVSGKLIVLDFDETLFFTSGSLKRATMEIMGRSDLSKYQIRKLPREVKGPIYELAYSKYKQHSRPNEQLISHLNNSRKGYRIMVLSARGRNLRGHTLSLIKKHAIRIDGSSFRKDVASEDEEWKLQMLKRLAGRYALIELYEDKKDNIDYIKRHLNSKRIRFYLVKRGSIRHIA
jgi:hypothetical protein